MHEDRSIPEPALPTTRPVAGDIVSARYRWAGDGDEEGSKIRPCLVIRAADDGSAVIVVPISTKQSWNAGDCIEIPPSEREAAGLRLDKRSWAKVTEVNRYDLPNRAVIPNTTPDGRLVWRRGRVSPEMLARVQEEIAYRKHQNLLKGLRVAADAPSQVRIAGIRRIDPVESAAAATSTATAGNMTAGEAPTGDADARARRIDRIRSRAAEIVEARQKPEIARATASARPETVRAR